MGERYVTRLDRFELGDFPMICVRSGLPATKLVSVEARRINNWPWFLLPISVIGFFLAEWVSDSDRPTGRLPFADGHVRGISASYDKRIGVIVEGAHPNFIAATRAAQGKKS